MDQQGKPYSFERFLSPGLNITNVIQLSDTRDQQGTLLSSSFWLRFETTNGHVEGKLFLPLEVSSSVVVFIPGFPGDGSTRFEEKHLYEFLSEGYVVFTARHNGTVINGPHSSTYINCPERQQMAKTNAQLILGTSPHYSIADWLEEPNVVLQAVCPAFDHVYVIAHSFGALAVLSSLIDLTEKRFSELHKIRSLISIGGATGRIRSYDDPLLMQWKRELDTSWAAERVSIGDVDSNIETLRNAYHRVHKLVVLIPRTIQMIFMNAWGGTQGSTDEYVTPLESIDIIATLGRGDLVIDTRQIADEAAGCLVHDMPKLLTSELLKLVRRPRSDESNIIILR